MKLTSPGFRRTIDLPNGQKAYQELWECPSDLLAQTPPVRAWAVLEVSWSPQLHQFVPSLRRLYTRPSGAVRQVYKQSVHAHHLAAPASGPDDMDAARRTADWVKAALPLAITDDPPKTLFATTARKVFLPEDVLSWS